MQELINDAFKFLNAYKRHRTLHTEAKIKGNYGESQIQELKMFQTFDSLELVIRGLQRIEREKHPDFVKPNSVSNFQRNSNLYPEIPVNKTKGEITSTKVGI